MPSKFGTLFTSQLLNGESLSTRFPPQLFPLGARIYLPDTDAVYTRVCDENGQTPAWRLDSPGGGGGTVTTALPVSGDGLNTPVTIADGAIAGAKLTDLAVTAAKIANATITDTQIAAANKDGVAGTASMRTLGTGAQQALAGSQDALYVHKAGSETVTGYKNFESTGGITIAYGFDLQRKNAANNLVSTAFQLGRIEVTTVGAEVGGMGIYTYKDLAYIEKFVFRGEGSLMLGDTGFAGPTTPSQFPNLGSSGVGIRNAGRIAFITNAGGTFASALKLTTGDVLEVGDATNAATLTLLSVSGQRFFAGAVEVFSTSATGAKIRAGFARNRHATITDAAYAVLATDEYLPFNTTGNAITATLPAASSVPAGGYIFKHKTGNAAVNSVTIARTGGDTIDGVAANLVINVSKGSYTLVSDGVSDWEITASV